MSLLSGGKKDRQKGEGSEPGKIRHRNSGPKNASKINSRRGGRKVEIKFPARRLKKTKKKGGVKRERGII